MALVTLTKENFSETINNNAIVVVDFWASWCAPCLAFAPIFEQMATQYPDIVFGKINTEEQFELAKDFNIRSIPTLMIFREKIMVFFEAGLLPTAAFEDLIKQAKALDMEKVKQELGEK